MYKEKTERWTSEDVHAVDVGHYLHEVQNRDNYIIETEFIQQQSFESTLLLVATRSALRIAETWAVGFPSWRI